MSTALQVVTSVAAQTGFDIRTNAGKEHMALAMLENGEQTRCSLIHKFGPGIYIREATYPAHTLIIGMAHNSDHYNVLLRGTIQVVDGNGDLALLQAPFMFVAPAGSKVGYTLTEVVWQNIYATTCRDVEQIEKDISTPSESYTHYLQGKLEKEYALHEEDRQSYRELCDRTGLDYSISPDDCIEFPYGNYSLVSSDSPIHGKGMFATSSFAVGDVIAPMRVGSKITPAGRLVNHAKEPNCEVQCCAIGNLYLVAIQNINGMYGGQVGDELTLDYGRSHNVDNLNLEVL